jgi:arsenite methyltransferase
VSEERRDQWAHWILERRFGGDAEAAERLLQYLEPIRQRVIRNAAIVEGDVVLDAGCGDGFIGFGALEKVGERGRVVFADISQELLEVAEGNAAAAGVYERCSFIESHVEELRLGSASVDVVVARSVLIYVEDKQKAFAELERVLRDGGRLSLFEPINSFAAPMRSTPWPFGYDLGEANPLAVRVQGLFRKLQPPESDPMLNFDEKELLAAAADAGFFPSTLELSASIAPATPQAWDLFATTAWNPRIPSFKEAMDEVLSDGEQEQLTAVMRPLVETGTGRIWQAHAFLWATKP